MSFFLDNQQPLTLSKQLGSGGEGTVYALPNQPDVVAKIYHQAPTVRKQAKLTAMVLGCDIELEKIALWPKALVYDVHQQVVGFLMPRLPASSLAIHHLYNPSQRKKDFAQADYAFLIHAARNLAAAFAALHSHGHSVGDVNQGNLVVAPDATVKLIDCDSFQITTEQSVFVCEVGVAHFTPPELHGQSFGDIETTASHDNFGLAILIFHLLMMGRHPFAGVYLGAGEMTIEKAITEFRYAYSQQNTHTRMKPPPKAPSIDWLPQDIKQLFEEAFDTDTEKRPSAANWLQALESFQQQLKSCVVKQAHKYYRAIGQCPWCEFANKYRVEFFSQPKPSNLPNHRAEPISQIPIKAIKNQLYVVPLLEPITELPDYSLQNIGAVPIPVSNIAWSFWGVYVWVFVLGVFILNNTMPVFFVLFLVALGSLLLGGFFWAVMQNILIGIKSLTAVEWPLDVWMTSTPYKEAKQKYWQQKVLLEQFKTTWQHHITTAQHLIESKKIALSLCYEYSELIRKDDRSQAALNRLKELANILPKMPQQINQDVVRYKEYHEQLLAQWQTLNSELHKIGLSCSVNGKTLLPDEPVNYTKKDVMWLWFWILLIPNLLWLWIGLFGESHTRSVANPLSSGEWVKIDYTGHKNNNVSDWAAVLDVKSGLMWSVDSTRINGLTLSVDGLQEATWRAQNGRGMANYNDWRIPKPNQFESIILAANKFGRNSMLQLMPNLANQYCFWAHYSDRRYLAYNLNKLQGTASNKKCNDSAGVIWVRYHIDFKNEKSSCPDCAARAR